MSDYELLVIGGGTAGLGAARAGVRAGARTVMVQDGEIGGDCTFTGCVPSKTLIESAAQGLDFAAAITRVHATVARIAATEDAGVLTGEGIEVLTGRAEFTAPRTIRVDGRTLTAERVVLATGASPVVPQLPGLDGAPWSTTDTVFDLTALPRELVVLGGGPIGCELSQAFARLGSKVTVVQSAPVLLPREEPEASDLIAAVLRREGVDVRLGATAVGVGRSEVGHQLELADGTTVPFDRLLLAVGRAAGTAGLGLDAAGVEVTATGTIRVDDRLATTADGVWAAGDVTGLMPFTHGADQQGRLAAGNATGRGRGRRLDVSAVPWVTFTSPEVARVGMTEAQAAEHEGQVAYLPMSELDRAITADRTDGFVKLIAGPRHVTRGLAGGRILGATIVAERGGEMIHEPALAMHTNMFAGRLAEQIHAYPSWSMGVQQAAAQFFIEIGGRRARPASA